MESLLNSFFNPNYMPHGVCYMWQPAILWTNVISDLIIAVAYFSIPVAFLIIINKRSDIKFKGIFVLFAAFILCCGITHAISIYTIWHGSYGVHGIAKAITAAVSAVTAILVFANLKQGIALPSPAQFRGVLAKAHAERTKRWRLEKERKAEALFKFAVELIPTGLLVIDSDQKIKFANKALENIFGYGDHEMEGLDLACLLPPEHATQHSAYVDNFTSKPSMDYAMASGRIVRGRAKNGDEVSLDISLSVHEFEGTKFTFASVVDFDNVVTEKNKFLESASRIRRAVDATNSGIWEWNVQSKSVWYSPGFLKIIDKKGTESPDLHTWYDQIHPLDRDKVKEELQGHLYFGEKFDTTYRCKVNGDKYEWVHSEADTLFDQSQKPILTSGTITNVHEKKLLEEKLNEKTRFLNEVLAKSLCGLYIFDLKSNKLTYVNKEYTNITGYSADNLPGTDEPFISFFHPDELIDLTKHIADIVATKNQSGAAREYRFKRWDGDWIWCYSRDSVYSLDEDGNPLQLLGSFFDITELKQRECENQVLSTDFLTTFEQAAVGIAHVSLEGKFFKVNKKLADILGLRVDELMQKTFQEITHKDDLGLDLENVQALLKGEKDQYIMEKRYRKSNGEIIWVNLSASIVHRKDGSNSHFIAVIEEIGDRKRMEFSLADTNAAWEKIACKTTLEVREPLHKISTLACSLENRLSGKLDDSEAILELQRISEAAQCMGAMMAKLQQHFTVSQDYKYTASSVFKIDSGGRG